MATAPTPTPEPSTDPGFAWRYLRGLWPALLAWGLLVGLSAYSLFSRTTWTQAADEASLQEWLAESRVFRKTLSELVREYLALPNGASDVFPTRFKDEEIKEQLKALAEPIRQYQTQLPMFLEVFRLEIRFNDGRRPIAWVSPVPRPRRESQERVRVLEFPLLGGDDHRAMLVCEYRIHTAGKLQRDEAERQRTAPLVAGLVVAGGALAAGWVYRLLRQEREREVQQLLARQQVEHAERLVLENELRRQEAERDKEAAERSALEMKSQLYASIGIMAGSYAHNIKNLLVRPNDLLSRCVEADGLSGPQRQMLIEVRSTLGTVTERLQEILRTVRRDPNRTEMTRLDLNELIRETGRTWSEMARDKWKLIVTVEPAEEPLWIQGDPSHLQQAVENLLFNARDATFEMRNHLRDSARKASPGERKQALIEAAGWKGIVHVRASRAGTLALLEVRDNGIGMTEEVRQKCLTTHFSTKRDNALYEGYSAGMGLGLSFVAVVLDHHRATLEIESQSLLGAVFRVRFPLAELIDS